MLSGYYCVDLFKILQPPSWHVENYSGLKAWIVNIAKANGVEQLFVKYYFFWVKFIVLLNFKVHAKICVNKGTWIKNSPCLLREHDIIFSITFSKPTDDK